MSAVSGDPRRSADWSRSMSASSPSLWRLPGLDQKAFYAAVLYLHTAVGNVEVGRQYREPKTPEATRDFLDRLADCFARSKLQHDRRDHVSATAMVRNEEQKMITLYIAKNQSEQRPGPSAALEGQGVVKNENEAFATSLFEWFNQINSEGDNDLTSHLSMFETMCRFNCSRLEYYIRRISDADIEKLETTVVLHLSTALDAGQSQGWEDAKSLIQECQSYESAKHDLKSHDQVLSPLAKCVQSAGHTRKGADFKKFASVVGTLPESRKTNLGNLGYIVDKVKYLGRLFAAYQVFIGFCGLERQKGYSFQYKLLSSSHSTWEGDDYMRKLESWTGDLNLNPSEQPGSPGSADIKMEEPDLRTKMTNIVKMNDGKAPVHCEMQLLMFFLHPEAPKCEDYFGCSKKSCWLCWQMISKVSKHTMKDTHYRIYPDWVFPFNIPTFEPAVAEGLIAIYNTVLDRVQKIAINKTPLIYHGPLVQSSFRRTPAYQHGLLNQDPHDSFQSDLFSKSPITVPGMWSPHAAKALHLPERGSPRMVNIDAYQFLISDVWVPSLERARYGSKELVFAFQLITKPDPTSQVLETEDFQRAFWETELFEVSEIEDLIIDEDREEIGYKMYYRAAYDTLKENPHISSLCANTEPEIQRPIPYRGDVFIFKCLPLKIDIHFGLDLFLDDVRTLQDLQRHFERKSTFWDPERIAKREVETAAIRLSTLKSRIEADAQLTARTDKTI